MTILNVLVPILRFVFVPERGVEMIIDGASCLLIAGLMISCRVRGAYGASMD